MSAIKRSGLPRVPCRPILDLAQHLLQNCRDLDQAEEVCAGWPTTSGWSLVLTHWKSRAARTIERTHTRCVAHRYEDGLMVRTNDYEETALAADEVDYPGFRDSSTLRCRRARDIVEENKGRIDAALLANLLNDHFDPVRRRQRGP